ncbi:unnamed protein product, partial [Tenebrio molitor]
PEKPLGARSCHWPTFGHRVFFLKNPPRSLCCHDWVQLIRKYAAPAENQ